MLIVTSPSKHIVVMQSSLPIIGSKFQNKPKQHHDTDAGTFWEVIPCFSNDALILQSALLSWSKKAKSKQTGKGVDNV